MLPRLYAIVDAAVAERHGWTPGRLARAYLAGGARLLQVRAPGVAGGTFLEWCLEIVQAARAVGARAIINDRADLATLSRAAGVHVGQDDLPPGAVRSLVGPDALVGLSTHSERQLERARAEPISYVAVGPVFGTGTKDTGSDAVGLDLVRRAAALHPTRPVVAIGGITLERAPAVVEAGAASVAVISDLLEGGDPAARVQQYVERLS